MKHPVCVYVRVRVCVRVCVCVCVCVWPKHNVNFQQTSQCCGEQSGIHQEYGLFYFEMEAVGFSETSINIHHTTHQLDIRYHGHENVKDCRDIAPQFSRIFYALKVERAACSDAPAPQTTTCENSLFQCSPISETALLFRKAPRLRPLSF